MRGDQIRTAAVRILQDHQAWRRENGAGDDNDEVIQSGAAAQALLRDLSARLSASSTPWPAPGYLAQLTADVPAAVLLAAFAALLYNPNNVAAEASPVTTELERDVAADLCALVGAPAGTAHAHLASGGHAANYEALWLARNLRSLPRAAVGDPVAGSLVRHLPDRVLANPPNAVAVEIQQALAHAGRLAAVRAASAALRCSAGRGPGALILAANAHSCWTKGADLLGFRPRDIHRLPLGPDHRMDVSALEALVPPLIQAGVPIAAVVATVGSCGQGSVDDVARIVRLREHCERRYGATFHLHLDAALGGYWRALCRMPDEWGGGIRDWEERMPVSQEVYNSLVAMQDADSVTVDPHKAGHAPYPAGALVVRDRRAYSAIATQNDYLDLSGTAESADDAGRPAGERTLEGARPGSAAAAVWAAHRLIGLSCDGYGRRLGAWSSSALALHRAMPTSCYPPDLNVLNVASSRSAHELRKQGLWVSGATLGGIERLRLCVMKELSQRDVDSVARLVTGGSTAAAGPAARS